MEHARNQLMCPLSCAECAPQVPQLNLTTEIGITVKRCTALEYEFEGFCRSCDDGELVVKVIIGWASRSGQWDVRRNLLNKQNI
eukprot:1196058-Prorocentrum_minimum.AAC.1